MLATTVTTGRRCTAHASRLNTPWSVTAPAPLRCPSRRAQVAARAGTSVRATRRATTTTATPAAPMARMMGASNRTSPDRAMPTINPEKRTVRPAVVRAPTTAASTCSADRSRCATPGATASSSSRNRETSSRP